MSEPKNTSITKEISNTPKNKKLTEVKLKIVYNPSVIEEVSNFMSKCDLGVERIEHPQCLVATWTTTTKITPTYMRNIKAILKKNFEADGNRIISMEKIK